MGERTFAQQTGVDRVDLETLDRYLTSDRSPADSMLLSDLDGFLTGVAIGPELVLPSEWLPLIWGGEAPEFADQAEAQAIVGAIMGRYNEILGQIADDAPAPVFWADRDGRLIAMDWAEGFRQAITLRAKAWKRLLTSKSDGRIVYPILALCSDENGESLFGLPQEEEDRAIKAAAEAIPACVVAIAAYWRARRPKQTATPRANSPLATRTTTRFGRNDPCPCGSGRKFKNCCRQAG